MGLQRNFLAMDFVSQMPPFFCFLYAGNRPIRE